MIAFLAGVVTGCIVSAVVFATHLESQHRDWDDEV